MDSRERSVNLEIVFLITTVSSPTYLFMSKQNFFSLKFLLKPLLMLSLVGVLVLGQGSDALAARSGGRMGGGSFRAPSRSYSAPSRSYAPGGSRGYGGGGIGFPFLLPFFGFGGFGSLFSILIFLAIANLVINAIRGSGATAGDDRESENPTVTIAEIQVGLLASARELKKELDQLALGADTGTAQGRSAILQEASLALLRNPDYWVYGSSKTSTAPLLAAEAEFNKLSLSERSKFNEETLSNVNNQLRQGSSPAQLEGQGAIATLADGEYILVTMIVAVLGAVSLPVINDASDLRQGLQNLGGIGSDSLLAIEVLWTPQAEGDSLTRDDIVAEYPNLKLV